MALGETSQVYVALMFIISVEGSRGVYRSDNNIRYIVVLLDYDVK